MTFDWEQVLGTGGTSLATAYDEAASDELYRDRPSATPPRSPVDLGDEVVNLPFKEV